MRERSLNGKWSLGFCEDSDLSKISRTVTSVKELEQHGIQMIEAQVPGNFELDMEKAGLLPDLFYGMNLLKAQELEMLHLFYSKKFCLFIDDCKKPMQIVFEGIDTAAEIYLNGILLGTTEDMFLKYVFSADCLYEGENELFVHILPISLKAREQEGEMYLRALPYNYDSLSIRKAAYMWGWDIFPRILSGGIWKGVSIIEEKKTEILQAYVFVDKLSEDNRKADIQCFYDLKLQGQKYKELELELEGSCGSSHFRVRERLWSRTGCLHLSLEEPLLWWPAGSGEQNMYKVSLRLLHCGEMVDSKKINLGIRTVELERTSVTDENGAGEFCFRVNHKKVFIKGTNWVPLDSFPSRGKERIKDALELAEDIGCNMVRCWGGGYYEYDEFYDICDEKGILVWQDFMMACGCYPQDGEFQELLYKEAVHVIQRLRQHPSLCLWSGDNECDQFIEPHRYPGLNPNDNVTTRHTIKDAVRRNDNVRPYLPSSPYIDEEAYRGDISRLTENHLWGPRDYFKSDFYTKSPAHFASETGYHGCPEVDSIRRFITEEKLWPYTENAEWEMHASSPEPSAVYAYRIPLMAEQIKVLFGEIPDNLEKFSLYSQISQAEAMKFFVERFRMGKWKRTGIIWWNMIDGCPQFSDAVVDYYFKKKLAYYYIKQSQQPLCLMLSEPENGKRLLMGVNDTASAVETAYQIWDVLEDKLLKQGTVTLPADSAQAIAELALTETDCGRGGFLQIEWTVGKEHYRNHYVAWNVPYDFEKYALGAMKCGYMLHR